MCGCCRPSRFLQDTASELLYPLLPIYLTSVLGAPAAVVGAVEGAAEGAASLTKLAAGPLGDRYARRPLIATGYGMAALGKVIVAAATAWPGVLAGRVVDRLGKGIRGAPRDALLVEDIDEAARGRVFGFHRAMDTFGRSGRSAAGPRRLRTSRPSDRAAALGCRRPRGAECRLGVLGAGEAADGSCAPRTHLRAGARAAASVLEGDGGAGRLRHRQLPRRPTAVAAQRDRLLGCRGDPGVCRIQPGVRGVELSGRAARRSHSAARSVRNRSGVLRDRLHRARPDHRHRCGVGPDRCLRTVHRMHRRRWEGVDFVAGRIRICRAAHRVCSRAPVVLRS